MVQLYCCVRIVCGMEPVSGSALECCVQWHIDGASILHCEDRVYHVDSIIVRVHYRAWDCVFGVFSDVS